MSLRPRRPRQRPCHRDAAVHCRSPFTAPASIRRPASQPPATTTEHHHQWSHQDDVPQREVLNVKWLDGGDDLLYIFKRAKLQLLWFIVPPTLPMYTAGILKCRVWSSDFQFITTSIRNNINKLIVVVDPNWPQGGSLTSSTVSTQDDSRTKTNSHP